MSEERTSEMSEERTSEKLARSQDLLLEVAMASREVLRPIVERYHGKVVATVVLVEVREHRKDHPKEGLATFAFGDHCVVGNIPEDALPRILRHVADHEEKTLPDWEEREPIRVVEP